MQPVLQLWAQDSTCLLWHNLQQMTDVHSRYSHCFHRSMVRCKLLIDLDVVLLAAAGRQDVLVPPDATSEYAG